jgi:hypothetical protein
MPINTNNPTESTFGAEGKPVVPGDAAFRKTLLNPVSNDSTVIGGEGKITNGDVVLGAIGAPLRKDG